MLGVCLWGKERVGQGNWRIKVVLSMCTAQPSLLDLRLLWTDAAPAVALVAAAELGLGVQLV